SARGGARADAATRHAGGDAHAAMHGGTSLWHAEVSYLRTSALSAARPARSANRDQFGDAGLQPETHAQSARRTSADGSDGNGLSPSGPNRLACVDVPPTSAASFGESLEWSFVTASYVPGFLVPPLRGWSGGKFHFLVALGVATQTRLSCCPRGCDTDSS